MDKMRIDGSFRVRCWNNGLIPFSIDLNLEARGSGPGRRRLRACQKFLWRDETKWGECRFAGFLWCHVDEILMPFNRFRIYGISNTAAHVLLDCETGTSTGIVDNWRLDRVRESYIMCAPFSFIMSIYAWLFFPPVWSILARVRDSINGNHKMPERSRCGYCCIVVLFHCCRRSATEEYRIRYTAALR